MKCTQICGFVCFAILVGPQVELSAQKSGQPFPPIRNTQNPKDKPPSPQEAVKRMKLPRGFKVTLFAGEPDVHQPIAIHLDDRGRLWVAESYTYAADNPSGKRWDKQFRDRVLIFEDENNDGKFDKRKVFWDEARNLSAVTTGFGGAWVLCAPNLLFIPDRNGDDVPDGKPQVVLDGWVVRGVGHNIVNGLTWGPDGWLYGRHGIMNTSLVGRPGTPPDKRVKLNCAIWRYHPTRKKFEVVTHGTTNPWGFDYDDHGQMFFTNNVIGHLWHVIPGAHYKRMYGEDFNSHLYELIDQHADHYHWDHRKSWTDSRNTKGKHGELGGGHSHCGGMIYLGDNWPDKYRDTMFMCNTHGRRVNNDRLVRHGSGYIGKHEKDFLFANNPWFRGVDLKYGPDGGVYLSDWVDLGECHDHDGVHRTSGRIYKITYSSPKHNSSPKHYSSPKRKQGKPKVADVSKLPNGKLMNLQLHKNDWYVRAARRILQERASAGKDMKGVHTALHKMFKEHPDVKRKLRAMWSLHVTGGTSEKWLQQQLQHENEHIRVWAIRLLVDADKISAKTAQYFLAMAKKRYLRKEDLSLVDLFLASSLQRLPGADRLKIAHWLAKRRNFANDHNLPLMTWYGIEPVITARSKEAVTFAYSNPCPLLRKFVAKRITHNIDKQPEPVNDLVQKLIRSRPVVTSDILSGIWEGLEGRRKAPAPRHWKNARWVLKDHPDKTLNNLVRKLSVVFGDGRAVDEFRKIALNPNADGETRRSALKVLIDARPPDLLPMLKKLVHDRATIGVAVKGMAGFDDPQIPKLVINRYRYLKIKDRSMAIDTMISRPSYAKALLDAVAKDQIARADISAYHARQIRGFGKSKLTEQLSKVWGEIRTTPAAKKKLIAKFKALLNGKELKTPNLAKGRMLFKKHCANCHKLYGEGSVAGPDLTGSNRHDLDYLLINLIDPSAVVPVDFKMSIIVLKNGQVLNGVVSNKHGRVWSVQTQKETLKVDRNDVDEIRTTPSSLMPDGLLTPLKQIEVRDLMGYLMSRK